MLQTYSPKKTDITRNWFIVDAKDHVLGRLAARVAYVLRGKHKPTFSPHLDCGDHVIIINADQIKTTGNKLNDKIYYHHTGYLGHLKETPLKQMLAKDSCKVLEIAIAGMIPRNRLKKHVLSKLKIYTGDKHQHTAQNPQPLSF